MSKSREKKRRRNSAKFSSSSTTPLLISTIARSIGVSTSDVPPLGSKEFAEVVPPQKWASALRLTYRDQRGRVEGGWSDDKSMNDLDAEMLYILASAVDMRYGLINLMPSSITGGYETVINPDAQDAPDPFMSPRARTAIASMHNHMRTTDGPIHIPAAVTANLQFAIARLSRSEGSSAPSPEEIKIGASAHEFIGNCETFRKLFPNVDEADASGCTVEWITSALHVLLDSAAFPEFNAVVTDAIVQERRKRKQSPENILVNSANTLSYILSGEYLLRRTTVTVPTSPTGDGAVELLHNRPFETALCPRDGLGERHPTSNNGLFSPDHIIAERFATAQTRAMNAGDQAFPASIEAAEAEYEVDLGQHMAFLVKCKYKEPEDAGQNLDPTIGSGIYTSWWSDTLHGHTPFSTSEVNSEKRGTAKYGKHPAHGAIWTGGEFACPVRGSEPADREEMIAANNGEMLWNLDPERCLQKVNQKTVDFARIKGNKQSPLLVIMAKDDIALIEAIQDHVIEHARYSARDYPALLHAIQTVESAKASAGFDSGSTAEQDPVYDPELSLGQIRALNRTRETGQTTMLNALNADPQQATITIRKKREGDRNKSKSSKKKKPSPKVANSKEGTGGIEHCNTCADLDRKSTHGSSSRRSACGRAEVPATATTAAYSRWKCVNYDDWCAKFEAGSLKGQKGPKCKSGLLGNKTRPTVGKGSALTRPCERKCCQGLTSKSKRANSVTQVDTEGAKKMKKLQKSLNSLTATVGKLTSPSLSRKKSKSKSSNGNDSDEEHPYRPRSPDYPHPDDVETAPSGRTFRSMDYQRLTNPAYRTADSKGRKKSKARLREDRHDEASFQAWRRKSERAIQRRLSTWEPRSHEAFDSSCSEGEVLRTASDESSDVDPDL